MRLNSGFTFAASVLASVLCSCGGNDEPPIDLTSFTRPFEFLENGRPSGNWGTYIWPELTYVVRGQSDFSNVWLAREYGLAARPPVPTEIDFSKVTLLGISQSWGPTCFRLRITHVKQVGATLQVESELAAPPPLVGCTAEVVPLFDFVQIPKTDLPVTFLPTTNIAR